MNHMKTQTRNMMHKTTPFPGFVGALLMAAAAGAGEVPPVQVGGCVHASGTRADMHAELNLCNAPYFADPTGKRDSTEAVLRALDDVTRATLLAYRQGLAEIDTLPPQGLHYLAYSVEAYREDGVAHATLCVRLPFVPVLYFPEGTYLVSNTLCYRHKDLVNNYGNEMNQQIRIRGAGMEFR